MWQGCRGAFQRGGLLFVTFCSYLRNIFKQNEADCNNLLCGTGTHRGSVCLCTFKHIWVLTPSINTQAQDLWIFPFMERKTQEKTTLFASQWGSGSNAPTNYKPVHTYNNRKHRYTLPLWVLVGSSSTQQTDCTWPHSTRYFQGWNEKSQMANHIWKAPQSICR